MEKEFDVEIKEVLSRVQRVKAESLDDAINKAMDMYYSEKIVLGSEDMKGVDLCLSAKNSFLLRYQKKIRKKSEERYDEK